MSHSPRLFVRITLIFALVMGLGLATRPALAQAAISGVNPSTVSNATASTLVITGSGFVNGAVIIVGGYGALSTTFVSATVLTGDLPAGVAPGTYTLTVINPDATSASLPNALRVTAPAPTAAPTNTPAATAFVRPLLVVQSYGASSAAIAPGADYDFEMTLINSGQATGANIIATFTTGDFVPRVTGGVISVGTLTPGQTARFFQPLSASRDVAGKNVATLEVKVAYTDVNGTAYNETFTLTFPVTIPQSGPRPTATPTATAKPALRPQLLITGYGTDVTQLKPGARFRLDLDVKNMGQLQAKGVTLIVGGGTASGGSGSGSGGTPQPGGNGGVSGSGGEFTNFAPVGASNVQFLGDLEVNADITAQQDLIVNASTEPGAYILKISLAYTDDKGVSYTDDQVITLLVYQPPLVQISFYREPGPLFAGQPNQLPLQVVNLGRNTVVLGNLVIAASGAQLENSTVLVGGLDLGFPFTLDALVIPEQPGSLDLIVTVDYTDDFNQLQTITQTLQVEVLESGPIIDPGDTGGNGGSEPPPTAPETLWQMVWRFIRGLLGLDSAPSTPAGPTDSGDFPPPTDGPIIVPPGGKG
jgi:hypothetical protein